MLLLKDKLYQFCIKYVTERIAAAQKAIEDAREASLNDTKSSAGDKYETGRAMAQQEIDRNQKQLMETGRLQQVLSHINPGKANETVQTGSLVITSKGNFYISISAGQVIVDGKTYFAVSAASPVALKLSGLKKGNKVEFNGSIYKIEEIW